MSAIHPESVWPLAEFISGLRPGDIPADAARRILDRTGPLRAPDVRSVHCSATALATGMHGLAAADEHAALVPNTLNFRLDLSLAVLLLAGRLTPAELAPRRLADAEPRIRQVAARTRVTHDPALSQRTVAAVHGALNIAGLLGNAGPGDVLHALARARQEFSGLPGTAPAQLGTVTRAGLAALWALFRDRDPAYDLARRSDQVAGLALPCGGTVTVILADGSRYTETVQVPAGALINPEAEPLVRRKLEQGLALCSLSAGDRARAAAKFWSATGEQPADLLMSGVPGTAGAG